MKGKIVLFLILGLFLARCSEPDNDFIEYKFEIFNQTSHRIQIIAYDNKSKNDFKSEIIIDAGNFFGKSFYSRPSDRGYFFSDVVEGDSIKIIYDGVKMELYYCFRNKDNLGCSKPRNILSTFNDLDENGKVILNQYYFTEEDYKNATTCNGSCD